LPSLYDAHLINLSGQQKKKKTKIFTFWGAAKDTLRAIPKYCGQKWPDSPRWLYRKHNFQPFGTCVPTNKRFGQNCAPLT
jgi:hypothetical protein